MKPNKLFFRNAKALRDGKTLIIDYGGSRSSKTYSLIQLLTLKAQLVPNLYIIITSTSYPKIKKTVLRDFLEILGAGFVKAFFNKSELSYSFKNGSIIQFMNAEHPDDFKGVKSDYVLMDEINTYRNGREIYNQLEIRNQKCIFVTFNPTAKFWITNYWDSPKTEVIHSTYHDNIENIPQKIIDSLLAKEETDPNFYKVYVLGEWGSLEGLVFHESVHWEVVDTFPKAEEYKWHIYGLDFGFTNDPTCLVEVAYYDQMIWVREIIYETQLTNIDIANRMHKAGVRGLTIGDSAEPKSIEELWRQGINIQGAIKGPDSIRNGIDIMKSYKIGVHRGSSNILEEMRSYSYKTDKTGEITNVFGDDNNHSIDAIRYAVSQKLGANKGGAKAVGVF